MKRDYDQPLVHTEKYFCEEKVFCSKSVGKTRIKRIFEMNLMVHVCLALNRTMYSCKNSFSPHCSSQNEKTVNEILLGV